MVKFYICEHCGNIVEEIKSNGPAIVCCGEKMKVLEAGVVDAAKEKHIPEVKVEGGKLVAKIGSVTHPMEEKHFIEWIVFANEKGIRRVTLKPGDEPIAYAEADFKGEVYEYCNLHGLWKTIVK